MLTITITPTSLAFKNLTDEMHHELVKEFDLKFTYHKDKPQVEGTPTELYKTLYLLSAKYDIELI